MPKLQICLHWYLWKKIVTSFGVGVHSGFPSYRCVKVFKPYFSFSCQKCANKWIFNIYGLFSKFRSSTSKIWSEYWPFAPIFEELRWHLELLYLCFLILIYFFLNILWVFFVLKSSTSRMWWCFKAFSACFCFFLSKVCLQTDTHTNKLIVFFSLLPFFRFSNNVWVIALARCDKLGLKLHSCYTCSSSSNIEV